MAFSEISGKEVRLAKSTPNNFKIFHHVIFILFDFAPRNSKILGWGVHLLELDDFRKHTEEKYVAFVSNMIYLIRRFFVNRNVRDGYFSEELKKVIIWERYQFCWCEGVTKKLTRPLSPGQGSNQWISTHSSNALTSEWRVGSYFVAGRLIVRQWQISCQLQ